MKYKVPEILGSLAIFYCKAKQVVPLNENQKLVIAEILDQDFSLPEDPLLLLSNKYCKILGK